MINTFLSLLLTVLCGRRSGGWCRTYASCVHLWDMLVSQVFTEANFPYFSKGKPVSSWLISKSSNICLYKSLACNHATPTFYVTCVKLKARGTIPARHIILCGPREHMIVLKIQIDAALYRKLWKCVSVTSFCFYLAFYLSAEIDFGVHMIRSV